MKRVLRKRNKPRSPYANIDWEKALVLFERTPTKISKNLLRAIDVLRVLAKAADRGLVLLAKPDDPAAVEYFFHGTGPLTWQTKRMVKRFEKQRYATVTEEANGIVKVVITRRGKERALSYQLESMELVPQASWDRRWRVVIFDIPNSAKRVRDIFRIRLKQLGLYRLQESVYVSPHPCFDEIDFLRELYGVPFTVRYLLAEKIEEDDFLKQHFHLI